MKERILKKASSDRPDTANHHLGVYAGNPYSRENVNVPMGPREGNEGAHAAKRGRFLAAKAERAPLADAIEAAYGHRQLQDYEEHDFPEDGSIDENSHIKKFRASRSRYRD